MGSRKGLSVMPSDISVKIYGCRGSYPVSGPDHARYGGATSCVVVSIGDRRVVLDAGTGIAKFGREHGSEPNSRYDIFLSHAHFDHVLHRCGCDGVDGSVSTDVAAYRCPAIECKDY